MNLKAVFTTNYGGIDRLRDPLVVSEGWDYICFTDQPELNSEIWQIRVVKPNLPPNLAARYIYINIHLFLPEYSETLKVDSTIGIKGDLNKFCESDNYDSLSPINIMKHPARSCIYKEADIVVKLGIDPSGRPEEQMARYHREGFPENYGLTACGLMFRKNLPAVARHNELWFKEVITGSHRDQLSFKFVEWKYGLIKCHTFPYEVLHSEFFQLYQHGSDLKI